MHDDTLVRLPTDEEAFAFLQRIDNLRTLLIECGQNLESAARESTTTFTGERGNEMLNRLMGEGDANADRSS